MATLHLPKKRRPIPGQLDPHKRVKRALDETLEETFPLNEADSSTEPTSAEEALSRAPEKAPK